MEEKIISPADYFQIIKNRKWSLILPALLVFITALLVALLLPPVYKSMSTILIEEQEIPADFVITTVTSYAEQRIQSINQRIMSTTKLIDIINRFNLYADKKEKWTTEEIVDQMRKDLRMELISTEVMDRRTGRPSVATIAFTLSFEGKENPGTVQRVANVITSLFLQENLKVRERQTSEASVFLENEMKKVEADLAEIESAVAKFKEEHINELPELIHINMQSLNNIEQNIDRMNEQLRSLKEREGSLLSQISGLTSNSINLNQKRYNELKLQLIYLKSNFSDKYPDVIKTKAEIDSLKKQIKKSENTKDDNETNPVYITLMSQLAGVIIDIKSVNRQIIEMKNKQENYKKRIEATPRVEEQYKSLAIRQVNTRAKYEDLMGKLMEARVAQGLEKDQKGERFVLIDAARLPEKPFKPNRLAIILIGLVLGIGAGIGTAALMEFSDQSVKTPEALTLATSFPVLGSIPEIVTKKELRQIKKRRLVSTIVILVFIIAGIAAFHFFIMDLNVFWAKLMRKIS